uniref:Ammonium transporter AmtB-like domain-containing protein n=1 Tax=Palpitomonas bilix TaxID=652834 RepID=A0A7S3G222_9EUKA
MRNRTRANSPNGERGVSQPSRGSERRSDAYLEGTEGWNRLEKDEYARKVYVGLESTLNGVLAGLVAITASCAVVENSDSIIIGALSGVIYVEFSSILKELFIDDPLDASVVHFVVGWFGLLMVGFFARPEYVAEVFGRASCSAESIDQDGGIRVPNATHWEGFAGVFFGGNGSLLGEQVIVSLFIIAWTSAASICLFSSLRALRILRARIQAGLDVAHGGLTSEVSGKLPSEDIRAKMFRMRDKVADNAKTISNM